MCAPTELLIDTLSLYAPRKSWTPPRQGWQGWYTDKHGGHHRDDKAGWHIRTHYGTLRFEGSLRSLVHGDHLDPVTIHDLPTLHDYLSSLRQRWGLSFDIGTLRVGRPDVAANIVLPFDCRVFVKEVGRLKSIGTMKLSIPPDSYYGTYALWTSGQERATCIYNKGRQMWAMAEDNLLRVEHRTFKARIAARAGILTLADLSDSDKQCALWCAVNRRMLEAAARLPLDQQGAEVWRLLAIWTNSMKPIPRALTDEDIEAALAKKSGR